jgi:DNA-binding transcriptional regulator YdaS (Cro superfamily)
MDLGFTKAVVAMRGKAALARALGITPGAVTQWVRIPINRVIDVERVTGIRREELRPDLYRETPTDQAAE